MKIRQADIRYPQHAWLVVHVGDYFDQALEGELEEAVPQWAVQWRRKCLWEGLDWKECEVRPWG